MAFITDGKAGFSLSRTSSEPETAIGEQALANDMRRYVYVQASALIAANTVVKVSSSFVATANTSGNFQTTVSLPANGYGWVYEINTGVQA
jgi:hypothetical protein